MAEDDTKDNPFSDAKTTVEGKSKQITLKDNEKIKPKDIEVKDDEIIKDPSVAAGTKTVAPDIGDAKQLDADDYTQTPIQPKDVQPLMLTLLRLKKQKMHSLMRLKEKYRKGLSWMPLKGPIP